MQPVARTTKLTTVALVVLLSIGWFAWGVINPKPVPTIIKIMHYSKGKLIKTDVVMNDAEKYKECLQ